jgi:hypothetical protein
LIQQLKDDKSSLVYRKLKYLWYNKRRVTTNEEHPDYHNYGGKGCGLCDEWYYNFYTFAEWMINNGYKPQVGRLASDTLTIGRIDPDKGYYPDNCRIIKHSKNSSLARTNRIEVHLYDGVTGEYYMTCDSLTHAGVVVGADAGHITDCLDPNSSRNVCKGYLVSKSKVDKLPVPKFTKISGKQIEVRRKNSNELVGIFKRVKEIADKFGIPTTNVSKVLKGKRKSAKNLTFKYL